MAEFKLGRIKFVYQGSWNDAQAYVVDDVVTVGGKTYICVVSHTSSADFATDQQYNPTKWNLIADGTTWTGNWTASQYYNLGDQVKYGGTVYVCTEAHTAATYVGPTWLGLEEDADKWEAFATTFEWKGSWAANTRYKVRDIVTYGGTSYVCSTKHISDASLLEPDISNWQVFNAGIEYKGEWDGDSFQYKANDVVKYGADLWICTTYHTSSATFDATKFSVFVNGLQFESSWSDAETYQIGDVVTYGGYSYIAKQNHTNQVPSTATAYWDIYTTGFSFQGEWQLATDYKVGDVVRLGGYTYLSLIDHTDDVPPSASWARLNSGFKWVGANVTYTSVSGTNQIGSGNSATFNITRTGTVYTVSVNSGGTLYSANDVILVSGTVLDGISPANDLTITVTGVSSGTITDISVDGISVTWTDGTAYVLGDVVFFGASSYICVSAHIADAPSRPDADTTATYWNLLAAGSESAILTTDGDTVYYGPNGATRLPIGTDGQIMRVDNGYPSWSYYGTVNNLVYVSENGVDSDAPGRGQSLDTPWKTVRYAAKRVEEGYQNPNAKALISKNKQFLMKEITNWIDYTYSVQITEADATTDRFTTSSTAGLLANMPIEFSGTVGGVVAGTKYFVKTIVSDTEFTISTVAAGTIKQLDTEVGTMSGVLSYDHTYCERDTGILVDAIVFDLGHGGNLESTKAALAYYTASGNAYINSNFGTQIPETVAAYTYLGELIGNVLANIAPANNYQALNGNTVVADQIVDTTLVAETGTPVQVSNLVAIITDGISAGTATAIAPALQPNTTISVKTGTYTEILPIVVPNNTAIVGDELRGVVVQPSPAIDLLVNDKPKTISALTRIKSVIPNIVSNTTVATSAGNTQSQSYIYNDNESITSASVKANISTMVDILENGLTAVPTFTITDPANYDVDYFNARRLINANKAFLVSEVSAWIDAQIVAGTPPFNGFVYGGAKKTACERDVGYIVDALVYDLTYGGNLATQIAARSYYSNGVLVETGEKAQALAVQLRIKDIIDNIANGNTAGWTKTTSSTQTTSGTLPVGSAPATFAQARIQEMYDCINTGVTPTTIAPSTSWVSTSKVNASTAIASNKATIQAGAIDWINYNYPTLSYNTTTCSRDVGYIVDALKYDFLFGSNFLSCWNAMSYYRALSSTAIVLANQLDATTGVVYHVGTQVQQATSGTHLINANVNVMSSIIANGLTAVPAYNLPTPTAGTGNASDAGYYNAARLVYANKAFLQAEVSAWIDAQILAGTVPFNGFTYAGANRTKCERDVGYIVDALRFDLTYGGNLATVIAARSYYSNGVLVEVGEEAQALAVEVYLKSIIDNIVTASAITKTPANAQSQVTSGTAGSAGAALFAQARIQEIHDTIDTGTSPTTIVPDYAWTADATLFQTIQSAKSSIQADVIAWITSTYPDLYFNHSICSRDVGYIVDALGYDLVFGSNFLSSWNAMSYYRALSSTQVVLTGQLQPTLGTIGFIGASIKQAVSGIAGIAGNVTATKRIETSANLMYDIINNGITEVPAVVMPTPTGYNTSYLVGYGDAKAQLVANTQYIKDEIAAYLNVNYNSVWTALSPAQQANCTRDVGYIIDALTYDMTYGGNTQSLIVGSSYYSYSLLTIGANEKLATEAAYARLKTIVGQIILEQDVTESAGNSTLQNTAGTPGSAGSATFAQDRVQDIIDWIANGTANATILPSITWTSSSLQAAHAALQADKAEIQSDTVVWVKKFFQDMYFKQDICSRDAGLIVDALSYDMVFGSNFNSIKAGMSYWRALTATQNVMVNQKVAELGAITFIKYKAKQITSEGAVSQATNLISDITNYITGGAVPRILWPDFTGVDAENAAAAKLIWQNANFIKAETIAYISANYPAVIYDKATCARDVGYIVDAVRYDMTYGGNFATRQAGLAYYSALSSLLQIDSNDKTATLAAYGNLKTMLQDIANGGLSAYTPLQTNVSYVSGTAGDSASSTMVGNLIDGITTTIDNVVNVPAESLASTSWVDSELTAANSALQSAKTAIKAAVTSYIGTNYPALTYDSATCERDVGYIIDAVGYDFMFNSNFRSVKAGMSYYQAQASKVIKLQKEATIRAFNYLKEQISTTLSTYAHPLSRANASMDIVINILTKGVGETPEVYGTNYYNNTLGVAKGVELIRANKTFLANEATAWISSTYGGTITTTEAVTNLVTTASPHNLSVGDPIEITANSLTTTATGAAITGNLITLSSIANLVVGMPITFSGFIGTWGGITANTKYYVLSINSTTNEITISTGFNGAVFTITSNASTSATVVAGGFFGNATGIGYVLTVPSTTEFTFTATQGGATPVTLSDANGISTVTYYYNETACRRDMEAYLDAIVYDLQYTGNHKSLRAAQLYNNAVSGSAEENMFLVSNGTGLRNCTLSGLLGTLTNANQYGTKRPTAGAFVALNPGFGPNDKSVWVIARSHYSQNVTMFGTGCSGAKIDGAIHAGGNRSMVKNDFTTIISDGIGVWVTGSGALTELVSVFNYYGYAGYLAELGGRIRATNGNSSYGTYGVIAEGVDTYETPIYGRLDNRAAEALVGLTITDTLNSILRLEYSNAGSGYTNTVTTISGSGYNAEVRNHDEFRDGAVFETRIIDLNDSNGYGGTSYVTAANTAQTGSSTEITLAATDQALSAAYVGMRIQITAGTGVGQYANIKTYSNGTKVAQVTKDSFTTLTVTNTTITNNLLTVASTASIYPGMPILLGSSANGLTADTLYYVRTSNFSATQFSVSLTGAAGTAETITATGSVSIQLYAAGWDHVVPGTTIENVLDLTSVYIIEPCINYTAPGYTATARTMSGTATWNSATYGAGKYVAIANGSTTTAYSNDGKTWATAGALTTSTMSKVVYGGGENATASAIVGGLGGTGAVLQAVLGSGATASQVVAVNVINGGINYTTSPTIVFTPVSGGSGATATCKVLDGVIASVTISINGSGYNVAPTVTAETDRLTSIQVNTWGKHYFSTPTVTIGTPGNVSTTSWAPSTSVTVGQYLVTTDYNIYLVTQAGTTSTSKPTHTSGSANDNTAVLQYYGEQAVGTVTLTNAGVSAIALSKKGNGYTSTPTVTILDTSARYVAIATGANNSCYQTVAGAVAASAWSVGGSTGKTNLASLTYGNGLYVAVGGTSSAVSSSDGGATWLSRTITTTSGTWVDVAYGNGRYVAISTGDVLTSVSLNGAAWSAGGNLPTSTTWTSVAYGNGRFVAIASGGRNAAYSIDNGANWVAVNPGLPSSQAWSKISYGQGLFFAVATGTTVCATSPDGINWTAQAMPGSSSNWQALTFGNPSSIPTWVAVSNTSGTIAASIRTGAQALGRVKVTAGSITQVRMIEPGSSYPTGAVTATTGGATDSITVSDTTNLVNSQPVEFTGVTAGGLELNTTYYVIGSSIVSNTSFKVSVTPGSATAVNLTTATGLTGTYRAGPIVAQTDPNKVVTAALRVRQGDGALGNPSLYDRGLNNATATASTVGDGYADLYQPNSYISVSGLFTTPLAGANVQFASIPNTWFKLVSVTNVLTGADGNYTATFQLNPALSVYQAPSHNDLITTRLAYSQVRLTGHDYLYIGTGNYNRTNYPNVDPTLAVQANQELFSGGGRVFFTSTDQDGNFNVGDLFGVQQATGTATLNASAFNLAGLQSLQLGAVSIGVGSAVITQFSTDPYFTANSDSIVPTQKAIKSYITAQIGGGSSSLNVNTLTAGQVYIANNSISNTTGGEIRVTSKMNFTGGIDGSPVALGYFWQR